MSSRSPLSYTRTITFRLTLWYTLILIASVVLLFSTTYFLLYTSLKSHDKEAIASLAEELATVYQAGGLDLVEKSLRIGKKFAQNSGFLIRIADEKNNTLLLKLPHQWTELNIRALERIPPSEGKRFSRLPRQKKAGLIFKSVKLPDGNWLQVGKTTQEQDVTLDHFREVLGIVTIPLILIALMGGAFLSYRALMPIRHLIHTVREISVDLSKMGARVPNPGTNDELEELVTLFNEMLQKIEDLIAAIKNSLDQVAHDLKTPITRLRGTAELALSSTDSIEQCEAALADCIEESERILKLIDTVLDITEAETGAMSLEFQHIDLADLVEQIVDMYAYVAETKSIKLDSSVQRELWVSADTTRIGQALANIVDNAVKYTPEGGTVSVKAGRANGEIVIMVSDTGIGIPTEELPKIWERLYRGHKSRGQKGLGLGLTLVRAIVSLHQGRIEVYSRQGQGSTFTIHLPYRPPSNCHPVPTDTDVQPNISKL